MDGYLLPIPHILALLIRHSLGRVILITIGRISHYMTDYFQPMKNLT